MRKIYSLVVGLAVVLAGVLLFNVFSGGAQAALPRDCDGNSIINCGAVTAGELASKYNENKTGDLPAVYNAYGISASMIANAGSQAKMGEVHKDGRVTVGGETVATNAMSIGRHNMAGSVPKSLGGKTYYDSPPSTSFRSESIVAFVFFDANGQFLSAIISSCGNPVSATPVPKPPKPTYSCDNLTAAPITRLNYNFTASASAANGATITSYTFDFGDGKSETTANKTISHMYQQAGEYTAKVTANIKVGNETKPVTSPACQVKITIVAANYSCDALAIRAIGPAGNRRYAYDLTYTATNGAELKTVDYNFGDGNTQLGLSPAEAKTVEHTYTAPGTYTTTATLHFNVDDTVKDVNCQVVVTIGQENCPVPGKEHLPKDSPECVSPPPAPPELPRTGPMDFVVGGLGLGSLVAAGYYWLVSRRDLLGALLEMK